MYHMHYLQWLQLEDIVLLEKEVRKTKDED